MKKTLLALAVMACASMMATRGNANTITFDTPSGSTAASSGNPVDGEAVFTTSTGQLSITLRNLQSNPTDVSQCLSALGFSITTGQTAGTLGSGSGLARTVNSDHTYTDGSTVAAGWVLSAGSSWSLDVLTGTGHAGPTHTIIGGPNGSNLYANANDSIDHTGGPHNPFLAGDVTFTLNISGLTAASSINNVVFQFATTDGSDTVNGSPVPDGGTTVLLLGAALSGLGLIRRKLI